MYVQSQVLGQKSFPQQNRDRGTGSKGRPQSEEGRVKKESRGECGRRRNGEGNGREREVGRGGRWEEEKRDRSEGGRKEFKERGKKKGRRMKGCECRYVQFSVGPDRFVVRDVFLSVF